MVSQVNSLANGPQESGIRSTSGKSRTGQPSDSNQKKRLNKANELSMGCGAGTVEKSKGTRIFDSINSRT
ncbi:hypothetical protein REPUB_Repub01dG0093600 [Reevesia pubescens]